MLSYVLVKNEYYEFIIICFWNIKTPFAWGVCLFWLSNFLLFEFWSGYFYVVIV